MHRTPRLRAAVDAARPITRSALRTRTVNPLDVHHFAVALMQVPRGSAIITAGLRFIQAFVAGKLAEGDLTALMRAMASADGDSRQPGGNRLGRTIRMTPAGQAILADMDATTDRNEAAA